MTEYLDLEDVLKFIARSSMVLRDPGLLASAVARPQASMFGEDAYPDLAGKAAALMHSVAQNQALVDGNKRLALLCAHAFLRINGFEMGISDDDAFELLTERIPAGFDDIVAIAEVLDVRQLS
jgi:death-on-curing protein